MILAKFEYLQNASKRLESECCLAACLNGIPVIAHQMIRFAVTLYEFCVYFEIRTNDLDSALWTLSLWSLQCRLYIVDSSSSTLTAYAAEWAIHNL